MCGVYENYQNPIFKYKEVLYPDYIPDHLPHRMDEIKVISELIYEFLQGKTTHILIIGPPGTGKTVSVKYIFRKLEEETDAFVTYVNCFNRSTGMGALYAMFLDFYRKVRPTRVMPSRRGIAYDELMDAFCQEIRKAGKKVVVCLDEIDQLLPKGGKLLYDLSRLKVQDIHIQIIAISNDPFVFKNLDSRIISSFYPMEQIHFQEYTKEQMREIIQARVNVAFQEGVVTTEAIEFLAEYAANMGGDVRIARETLLRAGEEALRRGDEKVTIDHIKSVLNRSKFAKSFKILRELSKKERFILRLIPKEGIYYPQFFRFYKSVDGELGDRMLRYYMEKFRKLKLVSMERKGVGGSYFIKLNVPREILFEIS